MFRLREDAVSLLESELRATAEVSASNIFDRPRSHLQEPGKEDERDECMRMLYR